MRKLIITLATVLIAGCSTLSDTKVSRLNSLSCPQLAVALDYELESKREHDESSAANSALFMVTKGDLSNWALGDSIIEEIEAAEHKNAAKHIRTRQEQLGC
ncbi:hypothetical protein [Erythrobacter sp. YT30]|uniref:hypothetical protein n=1 Tax=Erythrobacter sp. YT30 TaxID=1735012 RepID=UPI00076C46F7|nr:hypothetical protein [Erythrobacter sp. YT30]KWV92031.1 hypothetical protein AUC45_12825 [Erythrobacter sp. YT30]